ncbi:hypothetical protein GVAV_000883 [Gurleya vavrai]
MNEIVAISEYVNFMVRDQGRTVDNVYYRMRNNLDASAVTLNNLRHGLQRKKKRRLYKIAIGILFTLFVYVLIKIAYLIFIG